MASRITELVLDCRDPAALAAWWAEVLGYEVVGTEDDGAIEIGPPRPRPEARPEPARGEGDGVLPPTILFEPVPEPTPGKLRLHLDLNATDRDQDAELQRLLGLGARPVDVGQGPLRADMTWHVLADPEGNEFCLLRTRVEPLT